MSSKRTNNKQEYRIGILNESGDVVQESLLKNSSAVRAQAIPIRHRSILIADTMTPTITPEDEKFLWKISRERKKQWHCEDLESLFLINKGPFQDSTPLK
jgi:hypothetical protein